MGFALGLSPVPAATYAPAETGEVGALRPDDLQRRLPLADGQPARVDEVARGGEASVNFWQLREGMPPHLHRSHEEVIVVLEGMVETTVGTRQVTLGPGDSIVVPRDTVHGGRVVGPALARGYSVFSPPFDGTERVPAREQTSPAGD